MAEEAVAICHSSFAAATLAMSCFPTKAMALDRLREGKLCHFHGVVAKQPRVKAHTANRRPDESLPRTGRRCPLTPTDPPGSIAAKFNDRVTKGVDPTVTFLGK